MTFIGPELLTVIQRTKITLQSKYFSPSVTDFKGFPWKAFFPQTSHPSWLTFASPFWSPTWNQPPMQRSGTVFGVRNRALYTREGEGGVRKQGMGTRMCASHANDIGWWDRDLSLQITDGFAFKKQHLSCAAAKQRTFLLMTSGGCEGHLKILWLNSFAS